MQRNAQGERVLHYTQLVPATPGSPLAEEWECYRREVGRLLAEGYEGRFVLIKGSEIIGIWDDENDARNEGARRYFLLRQGYLVHQIQEWEPLLFSLHMFYAPP